jgi:translation initiation factor IF-1
MGKSFNKANRQAKNNRIAQSVLEETELEGVEFGRVIKHLGCGYVRVVLTNKSEALAKIRPNLSSRGATPIVVDDIVVLSGREFEKKGDRFDIIAVLQRSQASKLQKQSRIPTWFLGNIEREGEEEDIFDHSGEPDADEEAVDVDAI